MATALPRIEIEYCRQCRWLLRAAWLAQELLTTFAEDLGEVALLPGTGGVFEVRLDGEVHALFVSEVDDAIGKTLGSRKNANGASRVFDSVEDASPEGIEDFWVAWKSGFPMHAEL